jgi:putative aldouronate transport system substrate-binding protein
MGNGLTRYTQMARETNPDFLLNTLKFPVLRKGDQPAFSGRTYDYVGCGAAITTACKNVEAAVRLLNYDFSDEGYILANFGIEGKSFTWDNSRPSTTLPSGAAHQGYPRYTDFIMNNPEFSRDVAMSVYLRVGLMSYAFKGPEFLEQRDNLPEQNGPLGRALWAASSDRNIIPQVSPTQAESTEYGRLMTDINTYVDEMTFKFIMGVEPINEARWNEFIQTQQRLGIARAMEIMRTQIDRYNKRP